MIVIEKNLNQMLTREKQIKIEFLQQTIEMAQQQTIEILQEGWRGKHAGKSRLICALLNRL